MNKIKSANAKVFLSLDLPEDKDKKTIRRKTILKRRQKDEAKRKNLKRRTLKEEVPKTATAEEKAALEKEKQSSWPKYGRSGGNVPEGRVKFDAQR